VEIILILQIKNKKDIFLQHVTKIDLDLGSSILGGFSLFLGFLLVLKIYFLFKGI
jgi:hypothetical protein